MGPVWDALSNGQAYERCDGHGCERRDAIERPDWGLRFCDDCFAAHAESNSAAKSELDQYDDRLSSSRVDLVSLIRDGIPEREYVPGGDGWLLKRKRYLVYSPAGVGKSLGFEIVAVEIVRKGGTVAIIDVENGAEEYARRLELILDDDENLASACSERPRYYEYPMLSLEWSSSDWAETLADCDVVIFDSSRQVLSTLGLAEDGNDDYSRFMARMVMPLSKAGQTTVILDNTGHDGDRPRGASAKSQLNEVSYALSAPDGDLDPETERRLVWRRTRGRFASAVPKALAQRIGGGVHTPPEPLEDHDERGSQDFRPTGYMERVSRYIEANGGCSQNAIVNNVEGKKKHLVQALDRLEDEGYIHRPDGSNNSKLHRSITPYREADDA